MNGAGCAHCGNERLAAPRGDETLGPGEPVVCGACGSLSVIDVSFDDEGSPLPWVRRPTRAEADELHRDPDVRRWLDAYLAETLRRSSTAKAKGPRPLAPVPVGRPIFRRRS